MAPRTRGKRSAEQQDSEYQPDTNNSGVQHMPAALPSMATLEVDAHKQVDVKTKFPVARIKRIIQADEEIGKVSQATPTAAAKALEQFMVELTVRAAAQANLQGSKKVTAQHLANAIKAETNFDFLTEICAGVPDEVGKKNRAKSEAKSEDSNDEGGPRKKKSKSKKDSDESD